MIKRLVVLTLIGLFALPSFANEGYDEFLPFGGEPTVSLSKESSEDRVLPSLDFYDGMLVPSETHFIETGLMYDDLPVSEVCLGENVARPVIVLPSNLFNSPIVENQNSNSITNRSVFSKNVYIGEASRSVAGVKGYSYETAGDFTFGAGYNRGLDKAQMEDNASVFTRYDAGGKFALNSQYIASSKQHLGTQYNSFKISPELKLSDQLRLRTGFQSYTNIPMKKGEVVLVYSPSLRKQLEALSFEVGVSQRYNTETGVRGSELRFSTGFKL